jgi:hypothetical protein
MAGRFARLLLLCAVLVAARGEEDVEDAVEAESTAGLPQLVIQKARSPGERPGTVAQQRAPPLRRCAGR